MKQFRPLSRELKNSVFNPTNYVGRRQLKRQRPARNKVAALASNGYSSGAVTAAPWAFLAWSPASDTPLSAGNHAQRVTSASSDVPSVKGPDSASVAVRSIQDRSHDRIRGKVEFVMVTN